MSQTYQQVRWFEEARAALDRALKLTPEDPELIVAQATFEFLLRKPEEMRKIADEGLRRWPQEARFHVIRSEALRLERKLPEAEAEMRQAVSLARSETDRASDLATLAH